VLNDSISGVWLLVERFSDMLQVNYWHSGLLIFGCKNLNVQIMTKRLIALIGIVLFVSLQLRAQLGVQLGYNFAKVDGVETFASLQEKSLKNMSGGVFFDKDVIPFLDLRLGFMYSPKGIHLGKDDFYSKTIVNYLEIPLQAKFKIGPAYALGGVYGAYAINGKTKDHYQILNSTIKMEGDLNFESKKIKQMDYGLKFGAGLQYGIGPLHVFGQVDYSFGLMNIYDGDKEWKNNVLGVSVGILLGFGK
jgi:hypothetical protein